MDGNYDESEGLKYAHLFPFLHSLFFLKKMLNRLNQSQEISVTMSVQYSMFVFISCLSFKPTLISSLKVKFFTEQSSKRSQFTSLFLIFILKLS